MSAAAGIRGPWGLALGARMVASLTFCSAQQNKRAAADLQPPSPSTQNLAAGLPSWFFGISALRCMERVSTTELVCRLEGQRKEARIFWQREFQAAGWTRVFDQGPVSVQERGTTRVRIASHERSNERVFNVYPSGTR